MDSVIQRTPILTNKKIVWFVAVASVFLLAALAVYFVSRSRKESVREQVQEQKIAENINTSLEAVNASTKVEVPSINPLGQAIPDVNPIEKANPFKNVYENPF